MSILISKLEIIDNIVRIYGNGNNPFEGYRIAFREKNDENEGLFFKNILEFNIKWNNDTFVGTLDLEKYKYTLKIGRKFDLLLIDSDFNRESLKTDEYFKCENENSIIFDDALMTCDLVKQNNKLIMEIKPSINVEVESYSFQNNSGEIRFYFKDLENIKVDINSKVYLKFKKRLTRDIFTYCKTNKIKAKLSDGYYSVDINIDDIVKNMDISDNDALDCFISVETDSGNCFDFHFPINSAVKNPYTTINSNPAYVGMLFKNYKNQLSLLIKKKDLGLQIKSVEITENSVLSIYGIISKLPNYDYKIKSLIIKPKMYVKGSDLSTKILKIDGEVLSSSFKYNVDLNSIFDNLWRQDGLELLLQIEVENIITSQAEVYNVNNELDNNTLLDYNTLDYNYQVSVKFDEDNQLCLILKNKTTIVDYETIKISILGSCLSRGAFTSSDYFNPTYKSKYKVINTNWHMSMASIVNEKRIESKNILDDNFNYLHSMHKEYVKVDLEKEFFNTLDKSKPEFLIIDFYQDAVRDLIVFKDETIISGSLNIRESEYLDSISDKATIITHNQRDEILSYWNEAIKNFAKKIVKYIPEDRIILHNAYSFNEYIDKEGNVTQFKTLGNFVKRNNYFFDYMNKSLLTELPNIKVIDLNNLGYLPSVNHPEKVTPTHFQSEYYKEFLKSLDDIVLRTLLKGIKSET